MRLYQFTPVEKIISVVLKITDMIKKDFQYYLDHQNELVKQYNGKYLIIKDQTVVDSYDTETDALFKSQKKYQPGTYIIQRCSSGDKDYTIRFSSPQIVFA
jgi:hypothetical protein